MKENPKLFIPITRVDEEQRMVYGYATTETTDSYETIIDLGSVKRCLPDYLQWRNIREMHQPSAVGRADDITLDEKGLYIGAKIVDDAAWKKVKEGVYKGFSIGGKKDYQEGNRIFMQRINEISLADRPSNEDCVFDTFRIFKEGDAVEEEKKEEKQERVAGGEGDIARYIGEEVWDVQTAASVLSDILYLFEKESQENHPEAAGQLADLKTVIEKLKSFIASEIKETDAPGKAIIEMVAGLKPGDELTLDDGTICRLIGPETETETIERVGKEISKKNVERAQAIHDHAVSMGASCSSGVEKSAGADSDIFRIEGFEQDGQQVEIQGAEGLRTVAETFFKRIVELESQPEAAKGVQRTFAVTKEQDLGGGEVERNKEEKPVEDPTEQIKRIHAAGGQRVTI